MDWENLEPDKYCLVGEHRLYRGRAAKIDRVVIHHNAGVNNSTENLQYLWNNEREASAHYQVEADGTIGQLVNDWDTAWHALNSDINARSIGIEHANISGPDRWQISDATIENGAHLTAAVCRYYGLGRPTWMKNVFPHSLYAGTSCPYQLDEGGEDHDTYMRRAGEWYDEMVGAKKSVAKPVAAKPEGGIMALSDAEQHELLEKVRDIHHEMTFQFNSRYDEDAKRAGIETDIYRDTMAGFLLELDRKCEDLHRNMIPAIYNALEGDK